MSFNSRRFMLSLDSKSSQSMPIATPKLVLSHDQGSMPSTVRPRGRLCRNLGLFLARFATSNQRNATCPHGRALLACQDPRLQEDVHRDGISQKSARLKMQEQCTFEKISALAS
jgi:hypothetical protein